MPGLRQTDGNLFEIISGEAQHNLHVPELKGILKLYKNAMYGNVFRDRIRLDRGKPSLLEQLNALCAELRTDQRYCLAGGQGASGSTSRRATFQEL